MGKTKKRIDKKNAVTFRLVHRSQKDPLITDETAPQHVLVECGPSKNNKTEDIATRKEEQRNYGIYFDDDYDYLQHLKDLKQADVEWQPIQNDCSGKKVMLPSSVFASAVEEEEGMLNKAALPVGPQLDWDPDVVAAMDNDFDYEDPNNVIDDDFVAQAMGSDSEEEDEDENDEENSQEYSDVSDGSDNSYDDHLFEKEETKSHFTNYSMSSSIVPRNEKLKLLDERFEALYEQEYAEETAIGALDLEDIDGTVDVNNSDLIKRLIVESERAKQKNDFSVGEKVNFYSFHEEKDVVEIEETSKNQTDRYDCESILSTYSNLYNHPKLIVESKKLRIDPKTGIPRGSRDGNVLSKKNLKQLDSENVRISGDDTKSISSGTVTTITEMCCRRKNETAEERKERKAAFKEYKRERRAEKKANKNAFKIEEKNQNKQLLNIHNRLKAVKLL